MPPRASATRIMPTNRASNACGSRATASANESPRFTASGEPADHRAERGHRELALKVRQRLADVDARVRVRRELPAERRELARADPAEEDALVPGRPLVGFRRRQGTATTARALGLATGLGVRSEGGRFVHVVCCGGPGLFLGAPVFGTKVEGSGSPAALGFGFRGGMGPPVAPLIDRGSSRGTGWDGAGRRREVCPERRRVTSSLSYSGRELQPADGHGGVKEGSRPKAVNRLIDERRRNTLVIGDVQRPQVSVRRAVPKRVEERVEEEAPGGLRGGCSGARSGPETL